MNEGKRKGVTMLELMVAIGIFALAIGGAIQGYIAFMGRGSDNLSKRLLLQMEARKALLSLYCELSDGLEVLSPIPGTTQNQLIYRDRVNKIASVFLKRDYYMSEQEKTVLFRAVLVVHDPATGVTGPPRYLMKNVKELMFTAFSAGSVMVTIRLHGGGGDFSLVNFVRLQNTQSQEVY